MKVDLGIDLMLGVFVALWVAFIISFSGSPIHAAVETVTPPYIVGSDLYQIRSSK